MVNDRIGRLFIISPCYILTFVLIVMCPFFAFAAQPKPAQNVNMNVSIEDRKVQPLQAAKEKQPGLKISLFSGESTVVRMPANMPRPARVELANPSVADAMLLSTSDIYISGKTPGKTTLALKGKDGAPYAIYVVEVSPYIAGLKQKLHEILPNETGIMVSAAQDSIVLSGSVSSAANLAQVLALARSYAPAEDGGMGNILNLLEVGGVHQVMLEVRVSEMQKSVGRKLGVNFSAAFRPGKEGSVSFLSHLSETALSDVAGFLGLQYIRGDVTWTALIDALKEQGYLKVLAEPTLIALSGKTANFLAGGEFPVPVPQSGIGTTTITIEYKPFGVGLSFTPTVLSNNKIHMQVAPEVSQLDFTSGVTLQGFIIPAINTRRVSTAIELADGQSFAIAGLLKDDIRENITKFPFLGDIPILGTLFRSSSFQRSETELVVIVTPHLVKPLDMTKQTLPTDQYVEPNDVEFYLFGDQVGREHPPARRGGAAGTSAGGGGMEGGVGHIMP